MTKFGEISSLWRNKKSFDKLEGLDKKIDRERERKTQRDRQIEKKKWMV